MIEKLAMVESAMELAAELSSSSSLIDSEGATAAAMSGQAACVGPARRRGNASNVWLTFMPHCR